MHAEPNTPLWVVRRLAEDPPDRAMTALRLWTNPKRIKEASESTMMEINALDPYRALQAVIELQEPKRYVQSRGTTKQQLKVATTVTIIQDRRSFTATSLIDCGCTGSCIDRGFVTAKCIPTDKLPRPIPIYNADGSFNSASSISDTVTLEITIGEHKEKRTFGVTNLGKGEIF